MTFDQLEIFEMIIEKGSFKAAAEALHRTQPTLSIAIKKLEEEYDLLLFSREAYRPSLTPAGEIFYTWAKHTLKSYRDLSVVGRELGTLKIEPSLTIVIDPLARFESLDAIFTECLGHSRPTELTLRSEALEGGVDLLLNHQADFAIAPEFTPHADIESYPFDKVQLLPCVKRSVLPKSKKPGDEWLKTLAQIIVRTPAPAQNRSRDFSIGVLESGRRCYVTDHTMKNALIREGFGWGRLARHEIEDDLKSKHLTLIESPMVPPLTLELKIMRNRQRPMGPVAKAVWTQLIGRSQS